MAIRIRRPEEHGILLIVMARLGRATCSSAVPRQVARTSRAMTVRERRLAQTFLRQSAILIAMGRVPAICAATVVRGWPGLRPAMMVKQKPLLARPVILIAMGVGFG
jgi:hypothetical protein